MAYGTAYVTEKVEKNARCFFALDYCDMKLDMPIAQLFTARLDRQQQRQSAQELGFAAVFAASATPSFPKPTKLRQQHHSRQTSFGQKSGLLLRVAT